MSQWIQDVPAIAMRGISKEYPWPGARCGWIEVLNRTRDENFNTYVNSLLAAKRLEVCSTTLPQMSLPLVCGNGRYQRHLLDRAQMFSNRADEAVRFFEGCDSVIRTSPAAPSI